MVVVLSIGLLLLPIMLTLGSVIYADISEKGQEQGRTRHEAVAVLAEDAPDAVVTVHDNTTSTSKVSAEWRLPNGTAATGLVRADNGLKAGAKVDIWLDDEGRVVEAPVTSTDAAAAGVMTAAFGWVTVAGLLTLAQVGIHRLLNRRRYRAWSLEWERAERDWNKRNH
ncbi:MAG: hypothetical protein GEV28_15540 [Actinophytocola sp.]|uniref:Rv1733c family protein n=1 Tax=Actinophytocola sp. TaxID=1872138 RepID=UPI00132AB1B6|nr:hypothetical protein [Actinophytocola sp.]MPZ81732.1 hypothetical protein [Actinophytocola sp.]